MANMRVSLINVHMWLDQEGETNIDEIQDYLTSTKPDVIGFNEVMGEAWNSNLKTIAEDLGGYQCHFSPAANENYGSALLVSPLIHVDKVVSEKLHVEKKETRSCLEVSVTHPLGASFRFILTHLHHVDEATRLAQLQQIPCLKTGGSFLLLGDFNALTKTDYSSEYADTIYQARKTGNWELPKFEVTDLLKNELLLSDCFQKWNQQQASPAQDRSISTCSYGTRIDYIWASPEMDSLINWQSSTCKIEQDIKLSDHHPVVFDIHFQNKIV